MNIQPHSLLAQITRSLLIATMSVIAFASQSQADVPAAMRKDFVTARNHITMRWNPQGYWSSPPGAFVGGGNASEVCAIFTQTERNRGKIPAGYSFSVNKAGQYEVSSGSIPKAPAPAPAAPAPAPVASIAGATIVKALPVQSAPPPAPKPVEAPKMKPVVESVVPPPAPKPIPVVEAPPAPKPAPAPEPAPVVKASPPPAPAPMVKETPPPAPKSEPSAAASANGIPDDMQKSYLSRHKPIFMLFDKDSGKWKSSEGALKDLSAADEWCKQATAIDRKWKRIPESFSYKHVGGGQLEVTKD